MCLSYFSIVVTRLPDQGNLLRKQVFSLELKVAKNSEFKTMVGSEAAGMQALGQWLGAYTLTTRRRQRETELTGNAVGF